MEHARTRYFLFISYKGTSYHGWQVQPNSVTVQEILDEALSTILREEIITTGAGRTDTGVHALVFCAHFDSTVPDLDIKNNLVFRLNRFLPEDIAVTRIARVNPEAHARFSAISRTYRYNISRVKNPFRTDFCWYMPDKVDLTVMNDACRVLLGHTDFTSFSRLHTDVKTNLCRITNAIWEEKDESLVFTIKADRFLRNMVRAIVGSMIDVGKGKVTIREFEDIIIAKDRGRAGKSAPARGLFLIGVEYPEELFK